MMTADMWKFTKVQDLDCSTQQFWDAIQVWINKPHTVNRRLVGSRCTPEADITFDIRNDRALALEKDALRKIDDRGSEVLIRELIPKQLGRFHSAVEKIIKYNTEEEHGCVFIPLVHRDEHGSMVHADNSMAYMIIYMPERNRLEAHVSIENEEPICTSLGASQEWFTGSLLPKLVSWCKQPSLTLESSSLKLVSVDVYTLKYQELKNKYGPNLVENWPEKTDPRKFVYEDIAIAAYLIVLWEDDITKSGSDAKKPTFVDLGCGNGLLVHILAKEGYKGVGLDMRKRHIWDLFGAETDLQERSITPSNESLFPQFDWLIGNHSDELTPWIPVMAARSSPTCKFFVLPCCPWDFTCKFAAKRTGMSVYQNYLNYVETVIETCGFVAERDSLRIPSTKKVCFVGRTRTSDAQTVDNRIKSFIQSREQMQPSAKNTKSKNITESDKSIINADANGTNQILENDAVLTPDSHRNKSKRARYEHENDLSPLSVESDLNNGEHAEETNYKIKSDRSIKSDKIKNISKPICDNNHVMNSELSSHEKCKHTKPTEKNSWASNFKARSTKDEVTSHCTNIVSDIREHIVSTVYAALLKDTTCDDCVITTATGKPWKRGGKLTLKEAVSLFDAGILAQLKSECGGLQTLLKNHHHIFIVQGGCVRLRDWTKDAEFDALQTAKKKKKGQSASQIAEAATKLWKTQLCYNHERHPDGCCVQNEKCRFAHGTQELRAKPVYEKARHKFG